MGNLIHDLSTPKTTISPEEREEDCCRQTVLINQLWSALGGVRSTVEGEENRDLKATL